MFLLQMTKRSLTVAGGAGFMAASADCGLHFFEPQWCDETKLMAMMCPCFRVSIAMHSNAQ